MADPKEQSLEKKLDQLDRKLGTLPTKKDLAGFVTKTDLKEQLEKQTEVILQAVAKGVSSEHQYLEKRFDQVFDGLDATKKADAEQDRKLKILEGAPQVKL